VNVLLAAAAGALFAIGTYLVIQRKLSRIIIGLSLMTHGANVLFVLSGRRGDPPLVGTSPSTSFSDPLPQAMALTAIVISFGVTAFLLALAYRSWIITDDDEVEDDVTDRLISTTGFDDEELSDAASTEADAEEGR
jgi:multicomponent Na+:H+ antiporter subunit C